MIVKREIFLYKNYRIFITYKLEKDGYEFFIHNL